MEERQNKREQKKQARDIHIQELHRRYPELAEADKALSQYVLQAIRKGLNRELDNYKETDQGYQDLWKARQRVLEKIGLTEAEYEPKWDCPICEDRGYIRPGVPCSCQQRYRREATFLMSGIPEEYRYKTFDNFDVAYYTNPQDMRDKVERCKNFVTQMALGKTMGNLILRGDVGRGKTHLSVAIANAAIACGLTVVYRHVDDLLDLIRLYKFDRDQDAAETKRVLDLIHQCDLLILDDLGSETVSDFAVNELTRIIEDRNLHNKPWIVSTNISLDNFEKRYDPRFTDRLIEKATIFRLEAPESIRIQLREQKAQNVTLI